MYPQSYGENSIVIGELSGRVDYQNVGELLKSNFYPVSRNTERISFTQVKNTPKEVVYKNNYPPPYTPQYIVIRFFESEKSLLAAIITEEIDYSRTESAQIADEIDKANSAIKVLFKIRPSHYAKLIAYNNNHPLLANRNIRKALTYAINKRYIHKNLLDSRANIAYGPLDVSSQLYIQEFEDYKYQPQRAMRTLRMEGCRDSNNDGVLEKNNIPLKFTLIYEKGVLPDEDIVRLVKLDWNKIGIDAAIRPMSKMDIVKSVNSGRYDALLTNIQFDDTVENLKKHFSITGEENIFSYYNKTASYFLDMAGEQKPPTRDQLMQGVVRAVIKDQPASFLFFIWLDWYFVNTNKFDQFIENRKEILPFDEWKFKK
ncbi:MAG: ABC transporter substrate-binding protein [candidate division KSB1 bacterium]|nr:ABC transporter substrate-binding protein [candidate division KSB1 bacterium]